MTLDENKQYYFTSGGERKGPISGSDLKGLADSGSLHRSADLIWTEGEADWVPAGSCQGLFSGPPPAQPHPAAAAPPHYQQPYPGYQYAPIPRIESRAKYGLYLSFSIVAVVIGSLGAFIMAYGFGDTYTQRYGGYGGYTYYHTSFNEEAVVAGLFIFFLGRAFTIVAFVFSLIYLAKCWKMLQPLPGVKTSPGKAVGFLFIPFFNFYWVFRAWVGWVGDYNRLNHENQNTNAPRVGGGAFITGLVLMFIQIPINIATSAAIAEEDEEAMVIVLLLGGLVAIGKGICWWIGMAGLCRGTNYLVDQHNAKLGMAR